jgi:deoxyribodipyrimidine photo-lyase
MVNFILHWFRRDLRLHDNTALVAAAHDSGGMVVPVFVLDDRLVTPQGRFTSAARVRFLLESLRALDESLRQQGSRLVFRRGDPRDELPKLVEESSVSAVYWNRDYTPYAISRDATLAQRLTTAGCTVRQFKDAVICEPDELFTKAGTPYTVYTPYARQWQQRVSERAIPEHAAATLALSADDLPASHPWPDLDDLGLHSDQQTIPGGEQQGQQLLQAFTDLRRSHSIATYQANRNMLALPATSHLSAHLHLGTVSTRACLREALAVQQRNQDAADGAQSWIGELAWRDFYIQILAHFPHVLRGAFKQQYDGLQWENDTALFAAWCEGRTGYPIVDAAMRQLRAEAWMHNRARMIVASFLTKDLLIDWRWGERYFMQHLVDGDLATNNGGWQWAAGTGTDAQPYFRIFNPISQGRKFDPAGAYVRRYVPELADVPDEYIHEPWKMSSALQQHAGIHVGHHYPAPVVDHAIQRQRALALYRATAQDTSDT